MGGACTGVASNPCSKSNVRSQAPKIPMALCCCCSDFHGHADGETHVGLD